MCRLFSRWSSLAICWAVWESRSLGEDAVTLFQAGTDSEFRHCSEATQLRWRGQRTYALSHAAQVSKVIQILHPVTNQMKLSLLCRLTPERVSIVVRGLTRNLKHEILVKINPVLWGKYICVLWLFQYVLRFVSCPRLAWRHADVLQKERKFFSIINH